MNVTALLADVDDPGELIATLSPQLRAKLHDAVTIDDPEWRIDNLYRVLNKDGEEVTFVRNEAQRRFWRERWFLNVILKARQLGFSTEIALEMLDECLFIPNFRAGIIDYNLDEAKKKLKKIKFAYARLPEWITKANPLVQDNKESIEFANGSSIEVGASHRGGTLQHLHISEFGIISAARPDKALEIRSGAFGTVHVGQRIDVESTAKGNGGLFYELSQRAEALQKEGRALSKLDFRFHFFAWWQDREYRMDPTKVVVTIELEEYFADLKASYGIVCDREQIAWYAAKRYQVGPDEMFREYPSFPEEAFKSSIEGAYFKRQMTKMRLDGRIGHVPFDETREVNTFWDIGNDTTSIWFHQTDGLRHRLIDYYENMDETITHYVLELKERKERFGWTFGTHYGPHDLDNVEWAGSGKSRKQIAQDAGLKFKVIPRVPDKNDAIDVARLFLAMCWIDQKHCERGLWCLDNYRKKWNEKLAAWSREPLHDSASHGADSLMTGAMGYRAPVEKKPAKVPLPTFDAGRTAERGTGWMRRG